MIRVFALETLATFTVVLTTSFAISISLAKGQSGKP
jgi:hypothetical protein